MKYCELKKRIQTEVNDFPMFFAFSNEQFDKGLEKFGCSKTDLFRGPSGCFYRKTDAAKLKAMTARHNRELDEAMQSDEFMIDALRYELSNHEYCITYDHTDALECLGLDDSDERVQKCLIVAKEQSTASCWD